MWSELLGPPGLILIAAIIGGIGAFWAAVKQSHLRHEGQGVSAKQTELLQDIAARGGNRKELEELIQARSRALNADLSSADNLAAGILKRLPERTAEFKAIEQHKSTAFENKTADFRLKWEPFINNILLFFDHLVNECANGGVKLDTTREDLKVASADPGPPSQTLRGVIVNRAVCRVMYTPVVLSSDSSYQNAELSLHIQDKQGRDTVLLRLELGVEDGRCNWSLPGGPLTSSGNVVAPKDGRPPREFVEFVHRALASLFERFLLVASNEG